MDAYLDAKVEHDFLETRAGKLALAIEKLKHTFLRSGVSAVGEYVVPDATFQPLVADIVKTIRPILENAGIPADKVAMIASEGKVARSEQSGISRNPQGALSIRVADGPVERDRAIHSVPGLPGSHRPVLLPGWDRRGMGERAHQRRRRSKSSAF